MQEEKKENLDGVMSEDELETVAGGICDCFNGLGAIREKYLDDRLIDCNCLNGLGENTIGSGTEPETW